MATNTIQLQECTRLPLKVIKVVDRMLPNVFADTPMGEKQLSLTEKHYPFIFGSVTQTEKEAMELILELKQLEEESKEYLFNQFLSKRNEK